MPWCPQCKEEYKEGITICPDCKVALVDKISSMSDFVNVCTFDDSEVADKFASYLNYSGISAKQEPDYDNPGYVTILVRENDLKRAKKHFHAFYSVEAANSIKSEFEDMLEGRKDDDKEWLKEPTVDPREVLTRDSFETEEEALEEAFEELEATEPYERRADKASDMFSTGVIFLVFGVIGLILWVLCITNVIKIFSGPVFFIFSGLMFLGFLVISLFSFKSYKKYKDEAVQEEEATLALLDWLKSNFTVDDLKESAKELKEANPEASNEEIYFYVNNKLKSLLVGQFGELDDSYLEFLTDDFYNKNFSDIKL